MNPKRTIFALLLALPLCVAGLAGCSHMGYQDPTAGQPSLPTPPTPASTTAYVGVNNPGYYALTVDELQKQFHYQPVTYPAASKGSDFVKTDGVLNLGSLGGAPLGFAVEQPGEAAVLRPGGSAAYPAVFVPQADCFAITGRQRYIYLTLSPHGPAGVSDVAAGVGSYGVFTASTSADGKNWIIGDNHRYTMPAIGSPNAPPVEDGTDPLTYSATCASQDGAGTVTSDPSAPFLFPQSLPGTPPTFRFHPNGLFVEDRAPAQPPSPISNALYGQVGMAVPNDAVSVTDIATGSYRGLVYEYDPINGPSTHPLALAPPADGSMTLAGGIYPGDDLTRPAGSQYAITLGKPDASLNGLFRGAQLSILDTNGVCPAVAQQAGVGLYIHAGLDAQGRPVCLTRGVAIVTKIQGKYVLYFASYDASSSNTSIVTQLIQFYLYQQ